MNLTYAQCKEIVSTLYRNGKSPAARISANWNSLGGRIGQYSHMIQYGSSKPRKFDSYELERKLGGYDVIIEIHVPGMHGFTGWIPSSIEYSTNLDDVAKECTYDSGISIDIWKVPATLLRKLEKETTMENKVAMTMDQLKKLVSESRLDEGTVYTSSYTGLCKNLGWFDMIRKVGEGYYIVYFENGSIFQTTYPGNETVALKLDDDKRVYINSDIMDDDYHGIDLKDPEFNKALKKWCGSTWASLEAGWGKGRTGRWIYP